MKYHVCYLCMSYAHEKPLICVKCKQVFCSRCIRSYLEIGIGQCPDCQTQAVEHHFIKMNPKLEEVHFKTIKIRCEFWQNGCGMELPFSYIKEHQKSCDNKPFKKQQKHFRESDTLSSIQEIQETQSKIKSQQILILEQLKSEKIFQNFAYNYTG